METIEGKRIREAITRVRYYENFKAADDCRVVFVSSPTRAKVQQVLQALDGLPIITVGEMPEFSALGGMINLINTGPTVKFKVNMQRARAAGLSLSSRMLALAVAVE